MTSIRLCLSAFTVLLCTTGLLAGKHPATTRVTQATLHRVTTNDHYTYSLPSYSDDVYRERVETMPGQFPYEFSELVKRYILQYTDRERHHTEAMMGLSRIYFPIFETYLMGAELPFELKFLPIIESNLRNKAVSPMGAAGLWQFIPSTARLYGLECSAYVDERLDPHRATEAATRLLSTLYRYYGDWRLALAAYNCGQGMVDRAIRKAGGSRDFHHVKQFLPRETQNYIPRFTAAAYLGNYFQMHDIYPSEQPEEYLFSDTIHVSTGNRLSAIAEATGVSYETIRFLNPAFRTDYIPVRPHGGYYIVTLPASTIGAIKGSSTIFPYYPTLQRMVTPIEALGTGKIRQFHRVVANETPRTIAHQYGCRAAEIVRWNGLSSEQTPLREGQTLLIPQSDERLREEMRIAKRLERLRLRDYDTEEINGQVFEYYRVRPGETIASICAKFPGVQPDDLRRDNDPLTPLRPGMLLRIRADKPLLASR